MLRALLLLLFVSLSATTSRAENDQECNSAKGDAAILACTAAINIDPKNVQAFINRGDAYAHADDLHAAVADFSAAIAIDPSGADAYSRRALAYRRMGLIPQAIGDFKTTVEMEPNNAARFFALSAIKFQTGDFAGAAEDAQRALTLQSNAHTILLRYLAQSRLSNEGEGELHKQSGHLERLWPFAIVELYLGKRSPRVILDNLSDAERLCQAHFYIAEWYLLKGDRTSALSHLKEARTSCGAGSSEKLTSIAEIERLDVCHTSASGTEPWRSNYLDRLRTKEAHLAFLETSPDAHASTLAEAVDGIATHMEEHECLADAEPYRKRHLSMLEKLHGPHSAAAVGAAIKLSKLYGSQRRFDEAESFLQGRLATVEQRLGPLHPELEPFLRALADIGWRRTRDSAFTRPLYERLAEVKKQALKEAERSGDVSLVDKRLEELVEISTTLSRWEETESYLKRIIFVREQMSGRDHPTVAKALAALADAYLQRKVGGSSSDVGTIEALYKRALAVNELASGASHVDVAVSLEALANFYEGVERFPDAQHAYARALTIRQSYSDDAGALKCLERLLHIYEKHKDIDPQINALNQVVEIKQKNAAIDPSAFKEILDKTAWQIDLLDRPESAKEHYERSLKAIEGLLGSGHLMVSDILGNFAFWHVKHGNGLDAEAYYKRAITILEGHEAISVSSELSRMLDGLADSYFQQERFGEAEPLYKRALALLEGQKDRDTLFYPSILNSLGDLYYHQRRFEEAEAVWTRLLERPTGEEADMPQVRLLNSLGQLYQQQGRKDEAQAAFTRAIGIIERGLTENRLNMMTSWRELAEFYAEQGVEGVLAIFTKAILKGQETPEPVSELFKGQAESIDKLRIQLAMQAVETLGKGGGEDSLFIVDSLKDLAEHYFSESNWAEAVSYYKRLIHILGRDFRLGSDGNSLHVASGEKGNPLRNEYEMLIKAAYRVESAGKDELLSEMFVAAQEALLSETAASVFQMAARAAPRSAKLSALARTRQELLAEWQARQRDLEEAMLQASGDRKEDVEATNSARLAAIAKAIGGIDEQLSKEFPKYASLVKPSALSLEEVQSSLREDEALLLFFDTGKAKAVEEETFIWVVTKEHVRWTRSSLGSSSLAGVVTSLRCGLDEGAWRDGTTCADLLRLSPDVALASGKQLPFDVARAHALYRALLAESQALIQRKHLLLAVSGPLAKLPFHVLAQSIPTEPPSGGYTENVALLGVEMRDAGEGLGEQAGSPQGVSVVRVWEGSPAEDVGLEAGDVLIGIGDHQFLNAQDATRAIRASQPNTPVALRMRRNNRVHEIKVRLGSRSVRGWLPLYLDETNKDNVRWLAHEHPITMLPGVSSLAALRKIGSPSLATKPMLGVGNPLLDGDPKSKSDIESAQLARERRSCVAHRKADVRKGSRGVQRLVTHEGRPNQADILAAQPLPETADELCSVASQMKAAPEDIWLGAKATKTNLKRLSEQGRLARYRLLHFATHATLAGELKGTTQPGLILTPIKGQSTDDGFLSASEVAGLRLDADWVVLSACNTAAASTPDADALSGLGRSFIYAGARALLVSHWAVDSTATVKLISDTLAATRTTSVARAEALRRAMLLLMHDEPGKFFHPTYWAPFVVVGGGAATPPFAQRSSPSMKVRGRPHAQSPTSQQRPNNIADHP